MKQTLPGRAQPNPKVRNLASVGDAAAAAARPGAVRRKRLWVSVMVGMLFVAIQNRAILPDLDGRCFAGDPTTDQVVQLNVWTYDSVWRIAQGELRATDARIFAPEKSTLLYSEPQALQALVAAPFRALGAGPVAAYNLTRMIWQFGNFLAVWWISILLLSRLGVAAESALLTLATLAAIWVAWNPIVVRQMGVVQLWSLWPAALGFWFMWHARPGLRSVCLIALATAMMGYSCLYYWAYFVFVGSALAVSLALIQATRRVAVLQFATCLAGIAAGSLALAPMLLPMKEVHTEMGFSRSIAEHRALALDPKSTIAPSGVQLLFRNRDTWQSFDESSSPGFGFLLVTVVGVAAALVRRNKLLLMVSVLPASVALLIALGPSRMAADGLRLWTLWPYDLLHHFTPLLKGMRSPNRAILFAVIALLPCSLLGLRLLWDVLAKFARRLRQAPSGQRFAGLRAKRAFALGLALAVGFIEALPVSGRVLDARPSRRAMWEAVKRSQCEAIVFVRPDALPSFPWESEPDAALMLEQSIFAGPPMANGYSGYSPAVYHDWQDLGREAPRRAIASVDSIGCDCVVLLFERDGEPGQQAWAAAFEDARWQRRAAGSGWALYMSGAAQPAPAQRLETRLLGFPTIDALRLVLHVDESSGGEGRGVRLSGSATLQFSWQLRGGRSVAEDAISRPVTGLLTPGSFLQWSIPLPDEDGEYSLHARISNEQIEVERTFDSIVVRRGWPIMPHED